MADDQRLERMENKLDDLSKAVISLARMEERMITLFKRMETYDAAQSAAIDRIAALEKHVGANGQMLRFAERLFWIIVAAGVTWFVKG